MLITLFNCLYLIKLIFTIALYSGWVVFFTLIVATMGLLGGNKVDYDYHRVVFTRLRI